MAWSKTLLNKILEFVKPKPRTLKDLGVEATMSLLTPDGIITKDVSDKMVITNIEDEKITFVNEEIVFPPQENGWRTVLAVQLVDGSVMQLNKGDKE